MKLKRLISTFACSTLMMGGAWAKNPMLTEEYWEVATVASVKTDLEAGADLLERNKIGRQGLHYALRGHASLDVLRLVLEQGVPIRPEGGKGVYAELYAARYGDLQVMQLLHEFGADFQVADYMGETPQYWLSKNKKPDLRVVDYFEKLGLDMNAQNRLGITPAAATALNKRGEKLFDYLVDKGSDPEGIDSEGRDLFMKAIIKNDNIEMLQRFYNDSEDPEAADNYGLSGVLLASIEGISEKRLAFLEDQDFDLNIRDPKGQTALHLHAVEGDGDGLKALLERDFDINAIDKKGNTPLHLALKANEADLVSAMLDAGADPQAANSKGVTPLMLALAREADEEMAPLIDRLIKAGADLKAQDASGTTTLIYAIKGGQPISRLQQILATGVDVNAIDGEATTALMHVALVGKDPEVLTLLLNAGADKTVRDLFDDTVAMMAADNPALKDSSVLAQLL